MRSPEILAVIPLPAPTVESLGKIYALHYEPDGPSGAVLERYAGARIRAVVTNGSTGFSAGQMKRFPELRVVCAFGAGYENIDVAEARARGIEVANAPGANAATVADHALGFMLALARGFALVDKAVRNGQWKSSRQERPALNGARLGILGLGTVGMLIAKRAAAFDMRIDYHNRKPRPGIDWTFHETPMALAAESDFLVAACPGGPGTRHIVNAEVLNALGPRGFLVNIARGSVVDTEALTQALKARSIAGAGLDVIEGEPEVPPDLLALDNVLFTPHMAGRSPAALLAQRDILLANLEAGLAGKRALFSV